MRILLRATLALALSACTWSDGSKVQRPEPALPPSVAYAPPVVEEFGERIKEKADAIRERIEEKVEATKEKIEEKIERAEEKIQEKIEQKLDKVKTLALDVRLDRAALAHLLDTGEALDWRSSVVDLIKLIHGDASRGGRRAYAASFGRSHFRCTARENAWLHARIIQWLKGEE